MLAIAVFIVEVLRGYKKKNFKNIKAVKDQPSAVIADLAPIRILNDGIQNTSSQTVKLFVDIDVKPIDK